MKKNSPYRPVLESTLEHALEHLENLERASVAATATLAELRERLIRPLANAGTDAVQIIDSVFETLDKLLSIEEKPKKKIGF